MKFPYREYISQLPGSSDFQVILRPIISMRVFGPELDARWDALVDTGADETLLPIALAELLGVTIDQEPTSEAVGISGGRLTIHYGWVEFRIESGSESITWSAIVGFADFGPSEDEVIILGHGGCLDYFTAIFDGENAEVELLPNSMLPADQSP